MTSDDVGRTLHDRATRGEPLAPAERRELKQWYATQDAAEMSMLGRSDATLDLTELQAQVDDALNQLRPTTQRIQDLSAQNDALREEVRNLRRRIAQLLPSEAA